MEADQTDVELIGYVNIPPDKHLIYRELEKHLLLGQWEFARALALTIISEDSREKDNIRKIMRKIAINPEIARIQVPIISRSHLSWLVCKLLEEISPFENDFLKKNAEFCLMLHDLLPEVQPSVFEELKSWYSEGLENVTMCNSVSRFSSDCCAVLKTALLANPIAISSLMDQLIVSHEAFQSTNTQIVAIYLESILHYIKQIEGKIDTILCISTEKRTQSVKNLLSLFSVFPELEEIYYEAELKELLIECLHDLIKLHVAKIVDITDIYSALLTRKSPHLLKLFSIEDDRFFDKATEDNDCLNSDGNFNHNRNGESWFRKMYLQCVNKKTHFLSILVDNATRCLIEGRAKEAWNTMENPLLNRLQPFLIILAWKLCSSDKSASNVLDVIKSWKPVTETDPVFLEIFQKLQYNLHITDWCIEKLRLLHQGYDDSVFISRRRNIFNQLLSQSPLRILHKTVGLKNIRYDDMLSILKFSKEEEKVGSENILVLSNSMVFRGYLSIMHVMDAIGACCRIEQLPCASTCDRKNIENWWNQQESTTEDKLLKDCSNEASQDIKSLSQANIDELSVEEFVDKYGFQSAYSHFVTEQLLNAKSEINKIYPIEFRVEILENIFSLLFVTGNDFQESDANNYDSGDVDVAEEESSAKTEQSVVKQSSSSNYEKISKNGFLCNELIIRDILAILKEVHLDTSSAIYTMLADERFPDGKESELKSEQLNSSSLPFIKSSVTKATLQQRMSRLLKYINEAQWRFELVASDAIPREFGMCEKYFCRKPKQAVRFISQESSETNDKGSEHFSSSSGREDSRTKRRTHKHNTHRMSLGVPDWQDVGFIHYMLASPSDLLCHSLWRKNYEQAKQVIQLFNLQTTYDASEAYFSENYAALVKEIESLRTKQRLTARQNANILNPSDDGMKASNLNQDTTFMRVSALAEAAAAGVQSTAITSLVDKVLSSVPSPIIPDFIELRANKIVSSLLAECKELNGVVLADCAYTANTTLETETMLLQMAMKRLKFSLSTADGNISESKRRSLYSIKGIARNLEQNSALSEEVNKCQHAKTHNFPPFFMPESACCRIIVAMLGSLDPKMYREQIASWQRFIDKIKEVETLYTQDSQEQTERVSERRLEIQSQLHLSFQTLAKVCSVNLRFLATGITPSKGHKYLNYLKVMYDHICHVSRALSKCKSHSYNADFVPSTSYFSVLKESPGDVLSKMMLQNGIPPTKLESFAAQMKVDLVHVITQKCFPYIPSSPFTTFLPQPEDPNDVHTVPCIVLNTSGNTWSRIRHPELAVRDILSEILSLIHDECMAADSAGILTLPIAISMLKGARLRSWMTSTAEIAQVDISLLKSKEENVAFFGNLCNIMWIHAIFRELDLAIQSKYDDLHHLKSSKLKSRTLHLPILSPNIIERLVRQKIYAYQIGESYTLSLLDLRYHILHIGFPLPSHLSLSALSYLFDFSDDVEVAVGVEPRLLFAICEGFVSSPKLQVLYPETVISQLDDAMRDYLCFHVEADCKEEKVKLPQLLNWYSQDFAGDDDSDWSRANFHGLITLVASYVKGNLQNDLQSLLGLGSIHGFGEYIDKDGKNILPFAVEFKPFTTQFGIIFDYDKTSLENFFSDDASYFVIKPDYYQLCHQTHIIEYLRKKCWMLSVFLGMTNNESSSEDAEENEESKTKSSAMKLTPETPLTRLMTHMQEIWYKAMGDHSKTNHLVWIVSALTPYYDRAFTWHCLDASIRREDWSSVLDCLLYIESANTSYDCRLIKDVLLQYLASFVPGTVLNLQEPWCYALRIGDTVRKAKCVLSNVTSWPEETCVKVLKACLADERMISHSDLHKALSTRLKEITLYQKIIQAASRIVKFESKVRFSTWQDVARLSFESPKVVLECIKNTEQYHLALEWSKLHPVESDTEQLIANMHISWLLDQDPPKTSESEQILMSLEDDIVTSVCHTLMKSLNSCDSKIFIVQYSLKHLDFTNRENEEEKLNKLFLGLKIISVIKEVKRHQYERLVYSPYLLLEQLLMNMQIDAVGNALKLISNVSFVNDVLPLSSIDQLLEQYAEKALEIAVVEAVIASSSSDTSSTSALPIATEKFVIPLNVPRKEEWVPDDQVRNCMVCQNQQFSMFNRRHHCRRCGRVVCQTCSQHKVFIEGYDNTLVRICDDCYEHLYPGSAEELSASYSPSSLEQRLKYSSTGCSSPKYYGTPSQRESISRRRNSICINAETRWLGKDEINNANIREEFYYEQAPSVSLCLSILKLHSDIKKCSSFVLGQCNKLFNMLIPKVPCTPNPEIDYALVISIIRSLLLNIKLKLSEAGIEDGAEYVDTYSTFLDLIKQLVNENCVHLLPEDSITSDIAIRKLRDALRKEEKMTLAIEVSAKYSLDTFGIWATWGKTFLQIGDWVAAREKFAHCLKKPKDRSQYQNESALLKDILNLLENATHRPVERSKSIMRSLSFLKAIQNGVTNLDTSVTFRHDKLDHQVLKECFYYLENYAYHFTYVCFYQRHGMICEAVNYIMKEKCDNEAFIEGLFLPCAKSGMLHKLKTAISRQDHSLKIFRNYFIATCKYLEKNNYYNLLYDVQLYMKDYIRAAMTNMWFFQEPAEDYTELSSRLHHMLDAKKSLETYLKSQQSLSHSSSAKTVEFLLTLPHDMVKKHIRKIDLQVKTTKYFADWESENKLEYPVIPFQDKEAGGYMAQEAIPTLLGDRRARNQIAAMMIINCKDIKQGLQMAFEIIQEFQLNWSDIIDLTSNTLFKCNCWDKVPCLIECACKDYNCGNSEWDEIILSCIKTSMEFSVENTEIERLINLMSGVGRKVEAYILCGKLMSAYRIASRNKRATDIQKILLASREKNQHRLEKICEQWLESNVK